MTSPAVLELRQQNNIGPQPSGNWVELARYQSFSSATPNRFAVRISGLVALVHRCLPMVKSTLRHFRTRIQTQKIEGIFDSGGTVEYIHTLECSLEMKCALERILDAPLKSERIGFR